MVEWIKDVLRGLTFLHDHHVVHRDLRLECLLLKEDGSLVISDFQKSLIINDDSKDFTVRHSQGRNISNTVKLYSLLDALSGWC